MAGDIGLLGRLPELVKANLFISMNAAKLQKKSLMGRQAPD
jgi:hypothetical protein